MQVQNSAAAVQMITHMICSHQSSCIVLLDGIIIINNKGIRPATTETEHKKALTHYLSSFDFLSHINSHPGPHHLHLMLWELKDPLWTSRLRRRGLGLALLCYSILPGVGVSIFTNIYCCFLNPHYHYILYLFFNATQRRWQTK